MARPRKLDTDSMLKIVDAYFETTGDPDKLKCSYLEEYAVSNGFDIKAYDFRRNASVRKRMEELQDLSPVNSASAAIAYKNLDVNAFLTRCRTKTMLRNSLFELDETWRRVYERAADLSKKNTALKVAADQAAAKADSLQSDVTKLTEQISELRHINNGLLLENRYLRKMLKTYLYPAIANQILIDENVLEQADTEVTPIAMDKLADAAAPSPFSGAVVEDRRMISREESLLNRMKEQIFRGQGDA